MDYTNAFPVAAAGGASGGGGGLDGFDAADAAPEYAPIPPGIYSARILRGEYCSTRAGADDLTGAVAKLPSLVPTNAGTAEHPLRMTGTEGMKADNSVRLGVVPGVVTGGISGHQSASARILRAVGGMESGSPKTLEMQGAGASQHRPASICISEDDGTRTRNHRIDSPVL